MMEAGLRVGERTYKRATLAMLAAGLASFNAMYSTQAMLPTLVKELGISPTASALTVSATTGMLALCIVPLSILSERFGRGRILILSALLGTLLGLALPFVAGAGSLILLRGLQGALIAGVPAVAMTWLSEEVHPKDLGRAMGTYIAGTTLGGLSGRLIPAGVLEIADWRWALGISSAVALALAIAMALLLPRQKNFHPKQISFRSELSAMAGHWRNPRLSGLFLIAFLGMGSFVSVYNFLGFRLIESFGLSEGLVGLVFLMYLAGTWSSARTGDWSDKFGRDRTMIIAALLMLAALALTAVPKLGVVLTALFLFTAAFFTIHSAASGWVGTIATTHRAEASSMYLFCYYLGSSLLGWLSGFFFAEFGWAGMLLWLAGILLGLLVLVVFLTRREAPTPGAEAA
ncbi:Inner membrane transport protein YnfM [Corynebacterium occultum]|uniref:Inner membrane transport protein YnfM n=1 Tax=Corynebacterium occultum TaxID=2675219 RepID=A0A6B8VSJ8_9CORY|nr:MFS transporter [Corynebacterium occultum]QGU08572.1 Inner membrane transport protein YnfM [Corynebacterium occultum]